MTEPLFTDPLQKLRELEAQIPATPDPLAQLDKMEARLPPPAGFDAVAPNPDPLATLDALPPAPWLEPPVPEENYLPDGIRRTTPEDVDELAAFTESIRKRMDERLAQAKATRERTADTAALQRTVLMPSRTREELLAGVGRRVSASGMGAQALQEFGLGFFVGWLERWGVVDEGTRSQMRNDYLAYKEVFTTEVDAGTGETIEKKGRKITANTLAVAASLVPIAPSGAVGTLMSRLVKGSSKGKSLLRATGGGAATGAFISGGEAALAPEEQRGGVTAIGTAIGAGAGLAGGAVGRRLATRAANRQAAVDFARDPLIDRRLPTPESGQDQLHRLGRQIRQQFEDLDEPFTEFSNRIEAAGGVVPPELKGILNRARNSNRVMLNPVYHRTEIWNQGRQKMVKTGEPLAEILSGVSADTMKDLETLMVRRRNLELWARKQAAAPGSGDAKLVISNEDALEAADTLNLLAQKYGTGAPPTRTALGEVRPEGALPARFADDPQRLALAETGELGPDSINVLDDLFIRYRDWSRRVTLSLHALDILGADDVQNIFKMNKQYVTFGRILEETQKTHGSGPVPTRRITKGARNEDGSRVVPPIERGALWSTQVSRMVDRTLKTRAMTDMAREFPDIAEDMGIRKISKKPAKVATLTPAEKKALRIPEDDDISPIFRALSKPTRDGEFIDFSKTLDKAGNPTGRVQRDVWEAPKDVQKALGTLDKEQAHIVMRVAGVATRGLRAGATGLNPVFGPFNVLRDQWLAPVRSKHNYIPMLTPIRAFGTEFLSRAFKGSATKEWDDFIAAGGFGQAMSSIDEAGLKGFAAKGVGRVTARSDSLLKTGARKFANVVKDPLYPFRRVNEASEVFTRFPEFRLSRQAGAPLLEAADDAAEVSLPFAKGGILMKQYNQIEAFANAQQLDFTQSLRLLSNPKTAGKTIVKALSYITIPAMGNWALNRGNAEYHELPEWKKAIFMHIPLKGGGFIPIPRPIGTLNVIFGLTPEYFARSLDGKFVGNRGVADTLAEGFIQQTPVGYLTTRGFKAAAPTVLDPLVENAFNHDTFLDRPLISDFLKRRFPEKQFLESTPMVSRSVGEALGVSPIHVQNIIESYTGGFGKSVSRMMDPVLFGKTTASEDPQLKGTTLPFIGDFARRFYEKALPKGFQSQQFRDFSLLLKESEFGNTAIKDANKVSREAGEAMVRFHPNAIDPILREMRKVKADLDDMRGYRRNIMDQEMDSIEKGNLVLEIDQAVSTLSAAAMERFAGDIRFTQELLDEAIPRLPDLFGDE